MEPRVSLITLGVRDFDAAVRFYRDGLGWPLSSISAGDFAAFKMTPGTALALHPRKLLAKDAGLADGTGFGGITLAHNVATRAAVDDVLAAAVAAGGRLLRAAHDADWGGYSGYFADLDGHPWEVAWNPGIPLVNGELRLP